MFNPIQTVHQVSFSFNHNQLFIRAFQELVDSCIVINDLSFSHHV